MIEKIKEYLGLDKITKDWKSKSVYELDGRFYVSLLGSRHFIPLEKEFESIKEETMKQKDERIAHSLVDWDVDEETEDRIIEEYNKWKEKEIARIREEEKRKGEIMNKIRGGKNDR